MYFKSSINCCGSFSCKQEVSIVCRTRNVCISCNAYKFGHFNCIHPVLWDTPAKRMSDSMRLETQWL